MNKLLLKKSGKLYKIDLLSNKKVEVSTFKECLGCVMEIEEGTKFKTFFNMLLKEKEFCNTVFYEDLHGHKLEIYEAQWKKPAKKTANLDFIDFLEVGKFFDVNHTEDGDFFEIFPVFSGVKSTPIEEYDDDGEMIDSYDEIKFFSINLLSVNLLKNYDIYLNNHLEIYNKETADADIQLSSFLVGYTMISVYDVIKSVLFEISCYGTPEEKQETKKKAIEQYSSENMLEIWEAQLAKAVEEEDYREAARLKLSIEKFRSDHTKKKDPE